MCHREELAKLWVKGRGVEIGALHKPLPVPPGVGVQYVDYKTLEENRARYPELNDETIVVTDIIDEGFTLSSVPPHSVDFIIANHALEHSPNPYGTLLTWKDRLKPSGVLYMALPIAETCFDRGRPLSTLEHLLKDHGDFSNGRMNEVLATTRSHLLEFLKISDANIRRDNGMTRLQEAEIAETADHLMKEITRHIDPSNISASSLMSAHILGLNRQYDIHYHTFSPESLAEFMNFFCEQEGFEIKALQKSGGGECIVVLKEVAT